MYVKLIVLTFSKCVGFPLQGKVKFSNQGQKLHSPFLCQLELRAVRKVFIPVGGAVEPIPSTPMAGHEQPPSFSRFRVGMETEISTTSHVGQEQ